MFIALDGPDGTGKTMLASLLVEKLKEKNFDAIYTSEPTNSKTGRKIREIIKTDGSTNNVLDLFLKDREEHLENLIFPALKNGQIIVCDRYKLSTICYHENAEYKVEELIKISEKFIDPDVYFVMYFDEKDIDLVFERIESRGSKPDVYDTKEWIKKVNKKFKQMKLYYKNLKYINANQSVEKIISQMLNVIDEAMKKS